MRILNEYYRLARDKRYVSSEIQAYNDEIKSTRRSSANMGEGNGSFLGNLLSTVGPIFIEYLNYRSQKNMRTQYSPQNLGYFPRGSAGGSSGQPNSLSGRYSSGRPQQPPNFYGNNYGFPFQNGGLLGQLLPALMTGSFGCSSGSGGAGMDLLSLLSGGSLGPTMSP
ncbi:hypothetical protein K2X05_00605, partial [bacterium]|nr:hypothetical protein [bacterium]